MEKVETIEEHIHYFARRYLNVMQYDELKELIERVREDYANKLCGPGGGCSKLSAF